MTSQQYNFDVEVSKVLNLMINSLYTNKDVALRELISNAADACDKLRYLATQDNINNQDELSITINVNKSQKKLIISDNGIGMNKQDLIDNLGTIARSGTENFIKSLSGDNKKDLQLIGQFGVGFYSSFMIADKVEVITKKYNEDAAYIWVSDAISGFTIEEFSNDGRNKNEEFNNKNGTKIILHLKDEAEDFLDRFHIKHVVQTYSDHINFKIYFIPEINEKEEDKELKAETLNSASAIWQKNKDAVTKEQYQEFYRHITHLPGEPFMTIHNKIEGLVSYSNLLFIPATKPFDLFHPDRKTAVKLYVKKVFISEELNLVPAYLRFIRGVIDSEDLPLNISRENLQHNAVIEKIKKSVISKVLSELKKKSDEDEEKYLEFWQNFGAVLKEGLCETSEFREKILEICRFYSSKSPNKTISIKEYIDKAKIGQDKIYFLTGENIEKIQNSPQLEIFNKKDIEVLFLTDAVDEFWVTVALPYQPKHNPQNIQWEFQSINRNDVDLNKIDKINKEEDVEDGNNKEEEIKDISHSSLDGLLQFCKEILDKKVADIRISKKLTDSPVCLAVDANAMDIRLERFLLEQKQIQSASAKILEINPDNKIIKNLNQIYQDPNNKDQAVDTIRTLFDLACIIEDEPIKDSKDFSRRLQKMLVL
jgi:molecular chaperone HtpG